MMVTPNWSACSMGGGVALTQKMVFSGKAWSLNVLPSPFSSGILLFKWAKYLENRWFLKRTMGEENGESNLGNVDFRRELVLGMTRKGILL